MTREQLIQAVKKSKSHNILLELPTSYGKSKIAIEYIKEKTTYPTKILIVIPRVVLKTNWENEFKKWGSRTLLNSVTFVTYYSFPKEAGKWNYVIFDECHHLSERCREALESYDIENAILLSATVKRELKSFLNSHFTSLKCFKVTPKEAIKENILPEPMVYLIPLKLDNTKFNQEIIKNKKKGNPLTVQYKDRWKVKDIKDRKIIIQCTQLQYYNDASSLIEWYKKRSSNEVFKNLWLHTSGERLKWLSNQKTEFAYYLLKLLKDKRTLTFCNSIIQTECLGKYCINSKNSLSTSFLSQFNEGRINHITACNMLDEGINLRNCQVGIYASLNSSERMIVQKLGRLLRHQNPIIIIPYYINTRDEEIVKKMCENYNPALIKTIEVDNIEKKLKHI